jgi:hypothetical protein
MNKDQLQQGDVLLTRVAKLPKGTKEIKPGVRGHVLAEGETTGHAHVIPAIPGVTLHEIDRVLYLNVKKTVKEVPFTHEEHHKFPVDAGVWKIGGVREKDYFQDMVRPVID